MTARKLYEAGLIELNKVHAPSLLLVDYNYFINKAIQQYANLVYTRLEVNQQSADDIRALKKHAELELNTTDGYMPHYIATLPDDYMHVANCIVKYTAGENVKCKSPGDTMAYPARRMSPDLLANITNNAYLKPDYKRPYYCIFDDSVEKDSEKRPKQLEIYNGKGIDNYTPSVYIDYIKTPEKVNLTFDDIDGDDDKSQVLEFPDYVCYEIVNIFVRLVMENASDPRLQTNMPINDTITVSD